MPDFLTAPFVNGPAVVPGDVLVRLLLAMVMGGMVAGVYRATRGGAERSFSFAATLVFLAILIAMVTQVIGDNIARAFSLVGALSIVRFRTVVRDTQDTAYVIFAVIVGMAVGAKDLWVAAIGIGVVGLAAGILMWRRRAFDGGQPALMLNLRIGLGHEVEKLLGGVLDAHLQDRVLLSVGTAKQGLALELIYETRLRPDGSLEELVKSLNRTEGVQGVQLQYRSFYEEQYR